MNLRLISRLIVLVLVVAVGGLLVVHQATSTSHPSVPTLKGADLGATPAPNFTLTDSSGAAVTLSRLAGHPVVVTFLYTHCPDECPLTAEKLHTAMQQLGTKATSKVDWLVVSVDPQGDTPAAAAQFLAAHHLTGAVRYLLGTLQQLQPVWDAYHIAVAPGTDATTQVGAVTHTVGAYLLDAQGRERIYLDDTFDPQTLTGDLRALGAG
ncbi:MAG: SCO family protein [Ktedonobacterales bacterium]